MFQAIYGTWDPRAPYGHATDMRWARIPHGLAGSAAGPAVRPAAERANLPARSRRIHRALAAGPPADLGVAARDGALRRRGGGVSHVVGRAQLAGAVPRAGVVAPGDPVGCMVDRGDQSNRTRGDAGAAGSVVVPDRRDGAGRSRRAHLQLARRSRPVAAGGQPVGESDVRRAEPVSRWPGTGVGRRGVWAAAAGAWLADAAAGRAAGLSIGPWLASVLAVAALVIGGGTSLGWALSSGPSLDAGNGLIAVAARACEPDALVVGASPIRAGRGCPSARRDHP